MKAITIDRYGAPSVLKLEEVPKLAPQDGEVLVKVHAASVNKGDWHLLRGEPFPVRLRFGLRKPGPRILGSDMAGRVAGAGANVTRFKAGDAVFGPLDNSGFGGFAEYVCAREDALVTKPPSVTYAEAAAVPLRRSPRCKACATTPACVRASTFWSKARPAAWAPSPCSSQTRSARG